MGDEKKALQSMLTKLLEQQKYHYTKVIARLEKLESKIDYATTKIRAHNPVPTKNPHVIPNHMVWQHQPFFVTAKSRINEVGIPDIRCYFLQSCLRSLDNVEGAVAECGVRQGKSALFMLNAQARKRKFFLFDSFEGLSDPTEGKDTLKSSIEPNTKERIFSVEVEQVRRTFQQYDNVTLMTGWIPNRFPEVANHNFYPRLSRHGILVCDDYGSAAYPGARAAMDEFFSDKPEKPVELPQGQAFIVKR
jgi:O-methyltransferase